MKTNLTVLVSILMMVVVATAAGAGTMAYFYGTEEKGGTFATGTLTLSQSATSGFNVGNLDCGDTWTAEITLTNTGTLDAMYVYMGFDVTDNAALADEIVLESIREWCSVNGWATTTFDQSTSDSWLTFWGATGTEIDGSISLWDLEVYGMPGGSSALTTIVLHTGTPPGTGAYLPAGQSCIIQLNFKLPLLTDNAFQGHSTSFTVTYYASNAPSADIDVTVT